MQCSVVIPTWQRASALRETLDSFAAQSCADFEVIVVSDGEDAATRVLAEEYKPTFSLRWIFRGENMGQSAARNAGAAAASGDIVLFIDDDTPAHPNLVVQHLGHFLPLNASCRIAVYGKISEDRTAGLPLWTDKFLQQSWEQLLEELRVRVALIGADSVGDAYERTIGFGLNCSTWRAEFLRTGGFEAKLRDQDEDMQYGHRLYRAGVRFVLDLQAIVFHRNTKSMTEYFRRAWYLSGQTDMLRVFEFGERNPQTRQIASMQRGPISSRLLAWSFYHATPLLGTAAHVLERATNFSGSRLLFGAWARILRPTQYWRGAKDAGFTPKKVSEVVGEPGCALMLHSISVPQSRVERTYYLSPGRFRNYMKRLKASGYESASLQEWLGGQFSQKRILLTFDDGYDDLYSELLPLAVEGGMKPLVFLVGDRSCTTNVWDHTRGLRQRQLLTIEQIREMHRHGVDFGSHSWSHPWLPNVSDEELRKQVNDSKRSLEDLLGCAVDSFAYPFGGVDQRVRAAVAEAGYCLAFTTLPGTNWWNDPLCLNRADINENISDLDFAWKVRSGFGVREWLAMRGRTLENGLPTKTLRGSIKGLRRLVRTLLPSERDTT